MQDLDYDNYINDVEVIICNVSDERHVRLPQTAHRLDQGSKGKRGASEARRRETQAGFRKRIEARKSE